MAVNLKSGYTFQFRNSSWKVLEVYHIQWNDNSESDEYKIKSNTGEIRYLEIEQNDKEGTLYSIWEKESGRKINIETPKGNDTEYVSIAHLKFPKSIQFKGIDYFFERQYDGNYSDGFETEVVNALDYYNKDESKILSIEVWEDETEFSTGEWIEESDISQVEEGSLGISGSSALKYIIPVLIGIFGLLAFTLNKCNQPQNVDNSKNSYSNDSTKVHRSSGYYRSRNSRGFGK